VVLVIDEAWRYWPKGTRQKDLLPEQQTFFSEHRHRVGADGVSCEIVLISQDNSQLALAVLALVQETYWHADLSAVGQPNCFRVDVHAGAGVRGLKLNSFLGTYSADVWRYYRSHTRAPEGVQGREVKVDGRGNIFKGALFRYGLPAAGVLAVLGIWGVVRAFDGSQYEGPRPREDASAPARAPAPRSSVADEVAARAAERERKAAEEAREREAARQKAELEAREQEAARWRIAGDVGMPGGGGYFILEAHDGRSARVGRDQCQRAAVGWMCRYRDLEVVSRPAWSKVAEVRNILAGVGGGQ
jgi:zona occludens toxin